MRWRPASPTRCSTVATIAADPEPPAPAAPAEGPAPQPAHEGLHWRIWAAEASGTFLLLFGGLSAVALDFGAGSPVADAIPSEAVRRLLTGLLFAGWVPLIATSTIGRLSGSHLNHAVTLAFAVMGRVSRHDIAGYLAAQLLGAVAGAAAFHGVWGHVATSVDGGQTLPSVAAPVAVALEAATTGGLVALIFVFSSRMRLARLTPFVVWPYIATMTLVVAPYTGSSLNPARSEGPAIAFAHLSDLWIYILGPTAGAVLVSALWTRLHHSMQPRTAKLFHDPRYPSSLGCEMPAMGPGRS